MDIFFFWLIVFLGLIAFDLAALWWGFDSRESMSSPEWERRRIWWTRVPAHHL